MVKKCLSALLLSTPLSVAYMSDSPSSCWTTSENSAYLLAPYPCRAISSAGSNSTWTLTIDPILAARQEMVGFGAAWTDATTYLFDKLSAEDQEGLMKELFTRNDGTDGIGGGIGMEFMRMTVGQSDLTPDGRWSFDENGNQPDPDLTNFDLTEPGERMLKWVKRMMDYTENMLLLGSAWSPPGWMKQNNNLRWEYMDSYVNYWVKFLQKYRDNSIKVDAITLQNEPLHSAPVSGEAWTMYMDASYAAILSSMTSAAVEEAGLKTEIWAYDHNTDKPEYPQYVLDNSPSVKSVAWHCYGGGFEPLASFAEANPGVKQFMTECWLHETTGEGFFDLPQFLMRPVQNGASGSLTWTLAGSVDLDVSYPGGCTRCTGLVQVDQKDGSYKLTKDFYNLGQFSKFVKQGAKYLNVEGDYVWDDGTGIESAGFVNNDGTVVLIVMNKFSDDIHLTLKTEVGKDVEGKLKARSLSTWLI